MEQPAIGRDRIRRKTTVADHFGCDSLRDFVRAVLEHLKIQVAVRIDEAGRDRQPTTVNYLSFDGGPEDANPLYGFAGD